ncbi:hypothetical protein PMZ80_003252 [Knufia obscura]|uniref:Flavin-containing monooxygenase n=1 Tax=Knufia obscura TaxID=1635080 RepID=A0ABR0RTP8_9EURO|nr:hypothetical protein PMZ80_003252 [Knufia obscura]
MKGISDGEIPAVVDIPKNDINEAGGLHNKDEHVNGRKSPNGYHAGAVQSSTDYNIPTNDQLAFTPRKIRVITVGAGFSGLMMAHKFQHKFPEMRDIIEHKIFEARHDIGGTWLVNTYPGVQCDVPSHIYAFPFDPSPDWTRFYSSGKEIHEYIKRTAKKWDLERDVYLNTRVKSAVWQDADGRWEVTVESDGVQRQEYAEVLISAQGGLDTYKWPDIKGINSYTGKRVHSAAWDHDFDYSHKRIAVIGNGSSGIQIVPQLMKLPGTNILNFARGPAWIYYRVPPSQHLGGETANKNPDYSEAQKNEFRRNPDSMKQHRKGMIARTNKAFRMFIKDSEANHEAMRVAEQQMRERLQHDQRLCDMLIPTWPLGCRRITPGEGYLEAFLQPNCDLTISPISYIEDNKIHTADGKAFEADVPTLRKNGILTILRTVVCATGFDVSFRPHYPTFGQHGINLREQWAGHAPESYLSVAAPNMPNYFTMLGPRALAGHGSLLEAISWNGDYMVKWLKKMAEEDIRYIVPKTTVVKHLMAYGDKLHKGMVWTGGCKSWYKQGTVDGKVTALFAGSGMLYKRLISDLRPEDFEVVYRSPNTWRFLGNGFTAFEFDEASDLAWYIEK